MMEWQENGVAHTAHWRSESGVAAPVRVVIADDTLAADDAWRLACEGTALLWRGDFQNARHLLEAMMRRVERKPRHGSRKARDKVASAAQTVDAEADVQDPAAAFHRHRLATLQRARTLGRVLIPLDGDYGIPLRRAPDLRAACTEVWGDADGQPSVVSLRELLGLIGAHQWRRKGIELLALGDAAGRSRIHPWYGVFSPVRGEYIDLVATVPMAEVDLAFDIGTGTGVIAAVLARRGLPRIVATEIDPRAVACARENLARLGVDDRVQVCETDLWPEGRAGLVVCNPPWIPARPSAPIERAIYDEESRMLRGFLAGLRDHLQPTGEGWLILSDLAEHLGLRTRAALLAWIDQAGLQVAGQHSVKPRHGKATDPADPLHEARSKELTTLWRLTAKA